MTAVVWLPLIFSLCGASVPLLVVEPEDTVVTPVGHFRSATLQCEFSCQDGMSVMTSWYKDGVAIEMASIPSYNTSNSSLVVTTTETNDNVRTLEGMYYCVVSNSLGAVRSRNALVRIQYVISSIRPASIIFPPTETVVVGQVGYVQQPLSDSRPLWSVACAGKHFICPSHSCPLWHHVSVAGRLLLFSILRITHNDMIKAIPECMNSSTIAVTGKLDYGLSPQTDQISFHGAVFVPRKTIMDAQIISIEMGRTATLYCISNHPISTYTWKQNGTLIQLANNSRYSFITDGVLQIHNIHHKDGGQYDCDATANYSTLGTQTKTTTYMLTVYSLPSVNLTVMADRTVRRMCGTITSRTWCAINHNVSSIIIQCDVDGSQPVLVQVLHNASILFTQNVTGDQQSVQHSIAVPSSGIYQCLASNPYGSKQTSLYVVVADPTSTVPTAAPSTSSPTTTPQLPTTLSTTASRPTTQKQSVFTSTSTAVKVSSSASSDVPTAALSTSAATTPAQLPPTLSATASRSTTQKQSVFASTSTAVVVSSSATSRSTMKTPSVAASTSRAVTFSIPASSTGSTSFSKSTLSTGPVSASHSTTATAGSLRTTNRSTPSTSLSTTNFYSPTAVTPTTTTTQPAAVAGSQTSSAAVAGGAAAGVIILLLLVIIVVVVCRYRRKKGLTLDDDKLTATVRSSTVYENPSYHNAGTHGDSVRYTESGGQEKTQFYETVNKSTAGAQSITPKAEGKEDERDQVSQYDVLNRKTDELPITTFNKPAEGYDVLNSFSRQASNDSERRSIPKTLDDEYDYATTDSRTLHSSANSYELVGNTKKSPTKSSSLLAGDDEEDSYALPTVANGGLSVSQSGGNERTPSEKQVYRSPSPGAYEQVVIDASQTKSVRVEEEPESVYAVAADEQKNDSKTAVPLELEYSYARPDVKRPLAISSDRVVVGAAVTTKRIDDKSRGKVGDEEEDAYTLPNEDKAGKPLNRRPTLPAPNAANVYATPDVKKFVAVPERVAVGGDEYAVSTKKTKPFQSGIQANSEKGRVSSSPLPTKRYTVGEDEYAVPTQSSKPKASSHDKNLSDTQPTATEHFTAGESEYAVTSKRSTKQPKDSDRGTNVKPEHYHTGEDEYAVSAKMTNPARHSKKAKGPSNATSPAVVDQASGRSEPADGLYAAVDDLDTKPQGKQ